MTDTQAQTQQKMKGKQRMQVQTDHPFGEFTPGMGKESNNCHETVTVRSMAVIYYESFSECRVQ